MLGVANSSDVIGPWYILISLGEERCGGLKQIGFVNADKLPGIAGVLYSSRWGLGGAVRK